MAIPGHVDVWVGLDVGKSEHFADVLNDDGERLFEYLLAKAAETVWEAVSAAHSELEPYLVPLRNYLGARRESRPVPGSRLRARRAHRASPAGGRRLTSTATRATSGQRTERAPTTCAC